MTKSFALVLALAAPVYAAKAATSALMPKVPAVVESPLPDDPLKTTVHRLSNGLTIYLSPNHEQPRVATRIAVRTGSKNDPSDTTGLAHYLEHMLFKGTTAMGTLDYEKEKPHLDRIVELYEEHFKAKDPAERERIYKEIDKENIAATRYEVPNEIDKIYHALGVRGLNAFTSDEETVYVADVPANRMDAWARLESERFAHPVFRLFQNELEIVYEEKNRSLDNAERLLYDAVNANLYKIHPYGQQPTLGTIAHLKNPSLKHMYDYFHRYYVPNNMAIALSGDFEPEAMLRLLEKDFGSWVPKPLPPAKTWPLPKPKGVERHEVRYEAEEKVVIAWPTVPALHPDADALSVMDMLMDNSAAGIINLSLNQAQRVKQAGSNPDFRDDAGDWEVWAVPKQGQPLEEAEALLMEAVGKLKSGQFSDDDISAVITSYVVAEKAKLESNEARAAEMATSFIRLEEWAHDVERLERLRRVTKADVLRVANKYIGEDRVVVYRRYGTPELPNIPKPNFTPVEIDATRVSTFAAGILAMPAKPIEPRWLVEGRDYRLGATRAGKIFAARNPFDDLFSISFHFDRGWRQERHLCAALSLLELSGAGSLSADELKKRLFALGTTMSMSCDEQSSGIEISGLDENLWPSLELLSQRLQDPKLDTDTLKNFVDVTIGSHQDVKKDPEAIHNALGEWVKRGKDSPVLQELSDSELRRLDLEELRKLIQGVDAYERRIAYVGNRPIGELAKLLDEDKRYKAAPQRAPVLYRRLDRPAVYFTHRDMVQSLVGVFAPDGVLDPDKILDDHFFGTYLGGGMSSVIFQEVREARSLAYSAWGGYASGGHLGDDNAVFGELGCQADKTAQAAELLRQLVAAPPMSQERFQETARAIEANYRTNPVAFREIPVTLMEWEDQGFTADPRPKRFERLLNYRLADLQAFAARLRDKPMAVYIVGHRDRVGLDALKKLGAVEDKRLDELFPY